MNNEQLKERNELLEKQIALLEKLNITLSQYIELMTLANGLYNDFNQPRVPYIPYVPNWPDSPVPQAPWHNNYPITVSTTGDEITVVSGALDKEKESGIIDP